MLMGSSQNPMDDITPQPYSPEEVEYRSQDLRAQQMRAQLLFHCYAVGTDDGLDDVDDPFWDYYADESPA